MSVLAGAQKGTEMYALKACQSVRVCWRSEGKKEKCMQHTACGTWNETKGVQKAVSEKRAVEERKCRVCKATDRCRCAQAKEKMLCVSKVKGAQRACRKVEKEKRDYSKRQQ